MGQSLARLRASTPANHDPSRDSSVHSCRSVHPDGDLEEEQDVLDSVIVDETAVSGPRAALQAAEEFSIRGGSANLDGICSEKERQHVQARDGNAGSTEDSRNVTAELEADKKQTGAERRSRNLTGSCWSHLANYFRR